MTVALKYECDSTQKINQQEIREMVLSGVKQIEQGKTTEFYTVCDRLEKKYGDATV